MFERKNSIVIDDADSEVIRQCLCAVAVGPFFPDWEFSTLFGFERSEVRAIAESWPVWDDEDEQADAVNNALNMLLGYPHGRWVAWHDYITPASSEVASVYARWLGQDDLDSEGKGVFDRIQ